MESESWSLEDLKDSTCPICGNIFKIGVTHNGKYICCECFDKRIEGVEVKEKRYVELRHVQELIKLMDQRNGIPDWEFEKYEKVSKKVKNTIDWLERNAKPYHDLWEVKK
ncbi:hypothetical protein Bcp1_007 [Bacillus phage Bcp1]|uniref:Uncharacterized protein n=1 Tax=Bacillus phage Bcp1 TaxID=584892 RepID=X2JIK4_9CAUD|nr:hypothetical protein Bcp1_007 [Bacillus phage Bcp1]AHN66484.1 hypothetical protein Bcp1_007 [Bacillus phage Bcp1]